MSTVSAIVIVRNGERFLAQALESIRAQTRPPCEVLVVDGRSTDRTREIARSFPEATLLEEEGRGIPGAYNTGIRHSRGDYVAFLSHDDLWTPDKLQVQVSFMESRPELAYSVARARFFLEPGLPMPAGFKPELLGVDYPVRIMETLLARREAFEIVGMLDEDRAVAEDVDWYARALETGLPWDYVPHTLVHKRLHDANTSLTDIDRVHRHLLDILRQSIRRRREAPR